MFYFATLTTSFFGVGLGGVYVEVDPSYTSQRCSSCENIDKNSRRNL
ncbi:zinc ribbon domain-containing protein [Candidatus Neptunichlamydia sp. REUL1]